ncbi:MAG: alpha/beta fold hydrolase [Planctomycetaceae bacterium]|nr:alpha/beta fold hydrolase [Planctomycetaceae bacterium]
MRARLRDTEIYFDVDGAGLTPDGSRMVERPTLFLLHGGPGGDHASFKSSSGKSASGALTDVAQLVYVDHRGCGRSAQGDPATYTLDNNIDDLDALRDHLGLERISVLGSSYGGMVALGYVLRYPRRVANLILVCTASSYRFIDDARRFIDEHGTPDQQRVCQRLWDGRFESLDQLREYYEVMAPLYSTTFEPEQFAPGWDRGRRSFEALNLGFGDFLRTFDFTDRLHEIECPTLVIGAARDWICAPHHSQVIAERIGRSHLKIFANSGHSVASDESAAYLQAIRGFLTYASL